MLTLMVFGEDGELLPETLTHIITISSSNEKLAQLAADHLEVDSVLGLAETKVRYLKRLNFLHVKDSYGEGEVSSAIALLPTDDQVWGFIGCLEGKYHAPERHVSECGVAKFVYDSH